MPWEKNFDQEEAIERIMEVFWQKGYEATSLTDLTEATGVKRQSLYNAFGGKRDLFVRALKKFDAERQRGVLAEIEAQGEPLKAIHDVFDQAVEDKLTRGCFLVNTSLEIQMHDEEVKSLASAAVEDFRSFYERTIDHAKERGEIPVTVDTSAAASALLAALFGIRVMGRGAVGRDVLRQVADQALRLLE